MTGEAHAAEALRWLDTVDPAHMSTADKIAAAQVHAQLATHEVLAEILSHLTRPRPLVVPVATS